MDLPPDFSDLLAEFARARVDYVVVGGYAVAFHGRPRATKDLDILLPGGEDNLLRASEALRAFGAPANVVSAVETMADDDVVFLGAPPLRVDLLRRVDGLDAADALARAVDAVVGGLRFRVIALDDLITNKRASGRTQDIVDVEVLERLRARRQVK